MIGKMLVRTAITGTVAMVVWNTAIGDSIKGFVGNVTDGYQNVSAFVEDPTSSVANVLASDDTTNSSETNAAAVSTALSCSVTIVVPEEGPRDGIVTDLRQAASDMEQITGMNVKVTRDPENITGERINANWVTGEQMTHIAQGTHAYAAIQTLPVKGQYQRTFFVNNDQIYDLDKGTGQGSRYNVLLHELGHIAGVGHLDGQTLMAEMPTLSAGLTQEDKNALQASTKSCR